MKCDSLCCPRCGYDLRGLPEPRCPECGEPFDPAELERHRHSQDKAGWLVRGVTTATRYSTLLLLLSMILIAFVALLVSCFL